MFTEREGGREGEAEAAITDDGRRRRRKQLFLVDILSFVPTDNPLSSIESERASESETIAPSAVPLSTAEWSLDLSQPTDGPTRPGPRLRPPPALPPDGSPFPLRAYAFV